MSDITTEFLWHATRSVPNNPQVTSILKCHFLSKCRKFENIDEVSLPVKLFGQNAMCKYCCNSWSDGKFKLRVLPKKVAGRRMKKILQKNKVAAEFLTQHETKLLANSENNNGNKMILSCLVCYKKTILLMPKPIQRRDDLELKAGNDVPKKKKKKKKKT